MIGMLTLFIALAAMSCTDKPAETTKEVVVVPAAPVTIVKQPAPPATPPTKIVLNKTGAKVQTKKVDVTVNKP